MIFAFVGKDDYRRKAALSAALAELSRGAGVFLYKTFDFENEGGFASVADFLSSPGLFSAQKAALLENIFSDDVTAKELKTLVRLSAEARDTAVFISEALLPKNIRELIGKSGELRSFDEQKGSGFKKYVTEEARARGLALSEDAASYLAESFDGNSWAAVTEIEKIRLLGKKEISAQILRALGVKKRGVFFELLSGWGKKSAGERVLNLEVLFADREDPAKIFNILAYTDPAGIARFADLDVAVKSGALDYEEALLSLALIG